MAVAQQQKLEALKAAELTSPIGINRISGHHHRRGSTLLSSSGFFGGNTGQDDNDNERPRINRRRGSVFGNNKGKNCIFIFSMNYRLTLLWLICL